MQKPPQNFWQIWNLGFGFLGLQLGWALQLANVGAMGGLLGGKPPHLSLLWAAVPLTGLIVQPMVGSLSDRTWGPLGRRCPYLLVGAVFGSLALLLLPQSSTLRMTAGVLWVLDISLNVGMVPLRALVADRLPESQQARGFAMQSVFIGLGSVVAGLLPWLLAAGFGFSKVGSRAGLISPVARGSFYLGALVFLGTVFWTILTTREYPPDDPDEFRRQARRRGLTACTRDIFNACAGMPAMMRRLAGVQFCTWLGLCCLGISLAPVIAHSFLGAPDEKSPLYTEGVVLTGKLMAVSYAVSVLAGFALFAASRRTGSKVLHTICLLCGAAALLSIGIVHDKNLLFFSMIGVGIAWASILSMPYALLAGSLPADRTGVYLGIFNSFATLPGIIALLFFSWIVEHVFHGDHVMGVVAGGVFLLLAAILLQTVPNRVEPITARADEDELIAAPDESILPA